MNSGATLKFAINTELTRREYAYLIDFIYTKYLMPNLQYFTNIVRNVSETENLLYFTLVDSQRRWFIDIQMNVRQPIEVRMVLSSEEVPEAAVYWLKNNLVTLIRSFEEQCRKSTIYFAWVEGEEIIPERLREASRSIIYRTFSESMLLLFVFFMIISILLFIVIAPFAPIILVILQFTIILFSDRFIERIGDWHLTKRNPYIHIFQYHVPASEYRALLEKHGRNVLLTIKKEIYEKTLAAGKPIDYEACSQVLSKYGWECSAENSSLKTVNLYEIVNRVSEKFRLLVPKIVVSNTALPNAAASGVSPSRGIILVTTGLLARLDENEVISVLGHEFSHLKGRDPMVLFLISSLEYLLRFYVFWPLFYILGYLYLFLALGAVYFVAKFFESKADLEAAIMIGDSRTLANALRKIGFRRLQLESSKLYAFQEWLSWDPHPPLYFRIRRLEGLGDPSKIRHPLIRSIKDNIMGFLELVG